MNIAEQYADGLSSLIKRIVSEEAAAIARAAQVMAAQVKAGHLIHVMGTGAHSMMAVEEVTWRAGGLAPVNGILDEGFSLLSGARRSNAIERLPGYAPAILSGWGIQPGEALVIVNAYGVNAATIDAALYCKEQKITSIAATSTSLQRALPQDHPARHPSRRNLCDLADIVIDSKVPMGDATLDVPGVGAQMGPVSTVANAFIVNLLMMETAAELAQAGNPVPVWKSANSPGGDEANRGLMSTYGPRIRKL
jgi:uncharacterized phosphosugar-binding protein